ncbi:multidrug effflux MFS transporter [Avrilella dinanensis]|uniref:Major facilitator superfamily (MFS) profile domain-containing protein n=1 Tax=Avrilella dinanensis TaxID=2008672 RepID=A0A2M9R6W7_9FLAO|nr:multidrug effflux MFS transporter [Avrilella dinanensis]PJR04515.1 hypothetical protein CDL10_08155 [Avrilella dinanensis]
MKQHKINKTFLIILLGILAAIGPFTIDMYLPAFGKIAESFGTDESHVAFTLTSYFFGIAIGQLIYGPVVDKYGRKKPLLFGLFLYVVSALGCAVSYSIEMMIIMRLFQALGGCVGMVASVSIISDVYEVDQRARAFSSIMLVMGIAPLIAPSLGSLFLVIASWEYIFYFLTAFALLVWVLIYVFLPETSGYIHNKPLKIKTIAINYKTVIQNKVFFNYTLAGSLSMAILFAYISSASYIFLNHYGLSEEKFSVLFAINASGLIIGNFLNGRLTKYYHYLTMAKYASVLLLIVSGFIFSLFSFQDNVSYTITVASLVSIMFLVGFINPNATAASISPFTANTGTASALSGAVRMGIGSVIAAVMGILPVISPQTMFTTIACLSLLTMIFLWKKV